MFSTAGRFVRGGQCKPVSEMGKLEAQKGEAFSILEGYLFQSEVCKPLTDPRKYSRVNHEHFL